MVALIGIAVILVFAAVVAGAYFIFVKLRDRNLVSMLPGESQNESQSATLLE